MSVKTTNVTLENNIVDDLEEKQEVEEITQPADDVNLATLEALKQKMKAKKEENSMSVKIVEDKKRSINFGVIGSGQCGSRLSQSLYEMGYPAVAMNTAEVDLRDIKLPQDSKLLLDYTIGGAAKSLSIGHEAAEANREAIVELVDTKLGDCQAFVFCASLGGGSGAGSANVVLDILAQTGKPTIALVVLPMSSDDHVTKNNAVETLVMLSKLLKEKKLSNCFIVDNARVENLLGDVNPLDLFEASNTVITEPLNYLNTLGSLSSRAKSIDPLETAKLLFDSEGLSIFGSITIPASDLDGDTAIAEAILANLNDGLLASNFDLAQAKYCAFAIIGNAKAWSKVKSSALTYANAVLEETASKADAVFRGLYESEEVGDNLKIFSYFSGLGIPTQRVNSLKEEVKKGMERTQSREKDRAANLDVAGIKDENQSAADKVKEMIRQKNSGFGKNFGGGKDFRK